MKQMNGYENNGSQYRQDDGDKLDAKAAVLKYVRHWPFFAGTLALTMLVAFVVDQCTPPVYNITGKFLIKEENYAINLFDHQDGGKNAAQPRGQKIANESIIIKSRSTAGDVLDRLKLDVEYYREGLFMDDELYRNTPVFVEVDWNHLQLTDGLMRVTWQDRRSFQLELLDAEYSLFSPERGSLGLTDRPKLPSGHYTFGEWVQFPKGRFLVNLNHPDQQGSVTIRIRDRESLIQEYTGDNLQVLPADKISSILLLTLDAREPYKGRDYLNTLMEVFLENELDDKNTIARNTIGFIDSQLSGISDSLHYAGTRLETFRSRHRTYNISSEGTTLYEKLLELEKSLSQEKFKRDYFTDLQQHLRDEKYAEIAVPSGMGIDDPLLNKLLQDLMDFQAERSRLRATQTESSPAVIEVNRKVKDITSSIIDALESARYATGLVIGDLSQRISRIERQFGKLPQTEQDLLNMQRRYSLNESIYTFLLQRRAEASIILASNTPSNKVIENAVLNLAPMRLRPLLNYFLAAILGLLIPVAIIFLKDLFAVRISDPRQVALAVRGGVLAHIGRNKSATPLVVLKQPRARIAEAFRALRANIDFLTPANDQLTILVTSSVAGEGKSFCALNLGCVYAACERRTLIVRCDLHKPFSFDSLGVPNTIGLSNYLSGQNGLDEIIHKTEHAFLDVLVPGPVPPNPAELLIGTRFKELLAELKGRYDVVVLDSSPLGLTNETLYVTKLVNVTLYILRQNYSKKSFIGDINHLKERKVQHLYTLLNDVADDDLAYPDGYGYYDDDKSISLYRKMANLVMNKAAM